MVPARESPTEADYRWVEDWDGEFCVVLVERGNPKDVLTGLVADPVVGPGPVDEARAWADEQDHLDAANTIEASVMDGWTVAFEDDGFQATVPEVLTALSVDTRVVVLFRNVNLLTEGGRGAENGPVDAGAASFCVDRADLCQATLAVSGHRER